MFLVPLLVLSLLIMSCGSNVGEKSVSYNFKQGYAEMEAKFLENSPPEKIYPLSSFRIVLQLSNKAAYDLTNGRIEILNLPQKYFDLSTTRQNFDPLEGRSLTNPNGGLAFMEFEGFAKDLFQNAEKYTANYLVDINYNTKMEFQDTVCINTNLYATYDAGCEVDVSKSYSGQGASLVVNNLEEIVAPGSSVEFRIYLKNRGKGKIGSIDLSRADLGGKEMVCVFEGEGAEVRHAKLKKDKQEAILLCKANVGNQNSYMTTLSLDFSYDYELQVPGTLNLVK